MNILIINGSPKGKNSITLQTCLYIKKNFPEHNYRVIHAGAQIRVFEQDFSKAARMINKADLILFCYPVYTFLAPSQLHRFIELMKENINNGNINVEGKYCSQISTSKHFYDSTAHDYISDNANDMKLRVIDGLSADMDDLTKESGRKDALGFFHRIIWEITEKDSVEFPINALCKVTVVADLAEDDTELEAMISRFIANTGGKAKLVNIHDFDFRGGCISCFNCASSGQCIYTDGFQEMLREEIQTGSAIVIAFSIKDHSMGSVFKTYDDRQFCNGHRTVTMGMPFAYLINGNLSTEHNLQTVIKGRAQVGGNYLAGIATNENNMEASVDDMSRKLAWCIANRYTQPSNFLGVGGMKIFRDLIWQMQGLMRADYKFYKENGQLDFPQKNPGRMVAMYAVGAAMNSDKIKSKIGGKMTEGMLMPYKSALKK